VQDPLSVASVRLNLAIPPVEFSEQRLAPQRSTFDLIAQPPSH